MVSNVRGALREWAVLGKFPKLKRDPMSDYRYFTKKDIDKLKKIMERG